MAVRLRQPWRTLLLVLLLFFVVVVVTTTALTTALLPTIPTATTTTRTTIATTFCWPRSVRSHASSTILNTSKGKAKAKDVKAHHGYSGGESSIGTSNKRDRDNDDKEKAVIAAAAASSAVDRYCSYWQGQLLEEHRELVQTVRRQRSQWSPQRMERRGMAILHAWAEPESELLGEKTVRIVRSSSSSSSSASLASSFSKAGMVRAGGVVADDRGQRRHPHGHGRHRQSPWQELFGRGDILEMTPLIDGTTTTSFFQSSKARRTQLRSSSSSSSPTLTNNRRRECLVMEVGDDWMTVGVGPTWPIGLWEARRHARGYSVRMDRAMVPLAPLQAQQEALETLRRQVRWDPSALSTSSSSSSSSSVIALLLAQTFDITNDEVGTNHVGFEKNKIQSRSVDDWASQLPARFRTTNDEIDPGTLQEDTRKALELAMQSSPWKANQSQQDAVIWALQRQLSLVRGPPGTGKSRCAALLIATALRMPRASIQDTEASSSSHLQPPRVLAVAHSNGAADVLLEALLEVGVPAVRAGRATSVSPKVRHRTVVALAERMPEVVELRRSLLLERSSRSGGTFGRTYVAGREWEMQQCLADAQDTLLQSAPVVVASCIGAHQLAKCGASSFPLVVLDEAAQCTEPALLCAIMAVRAEQVVLVGDTQQLPPTVTTSSKLLREGLGMSPMARLEDQGVQKCTLRVQYRMPPALMKHPSNYFYAGLVESSTAAIKTDRLPAPAGFPWPSPDVPLSFVQVGNGDEEVIHTASGRSNPFEARLVVDIVCSLLEAGDLLASSIAVLTPYSKQVQMIRGTLEKKCVSMGRQSKFNSPVDVRVGSRFISGSRN